MRPCATRFWRAVCGPARGFLPRAISPGNTGLSRGTIVSAFELLKSEGYLRGTAGSGTYVSSILPDALLQVGAYAPAREHRRREEKKPRVSDYARRAKLFSGFEIRPSRAFRPNLPASKFVPHGFMDADHGSPTAARVDESSAGLRSAGIFTTAGGHCQLPQQLARREMHRRTNCHCLRRAGSTRSHCKNASESRRSGLHGKPGICWRTNGFRSGWCKSVCRASGR